MTEPMTITPEFVAEHNGQFEGDLEREYSALAEKLQRRDVDIEALTQAAMGFAVAIPSWGVGTGGTRFARFPAWILRILFQTSRSVKEWQLRFLEPSPPLGPPPPPR